MHLTVEEALSIYPLSEAKLIAGAKGKSRIVKSINVMDAPDIVDWIKEGEMLLTTAYLIKDDPEQAHALLHKLNRVGSAGLGIKLGRFWDRVPEELIEKAEALNFPLIELPFQFTFSDQMNGLFRAELSRHTGLLQTVMEKQRELMRFALHSVRTRPLLESVSEVIGYPLAIISPRGEVLFNNSSFDSARLLSGWPWGNRSRKMRLGEQSGYLLPLLQGESFAGHVLFCGVNPLFLAAEESLFVQGAELIAYHMYAGLEDCFDREMHRDFCRLLRRCLSGELSGAELARAASVMEIGLLDAPYLLVLTEVPAAGERRTGELYRLKEEYLQHPVLGKTRAIHLIVDEGLLSIYPAVRQEAEELKGLLESCFLKTGPAGPCEPKAAISGCKSGAGELREAFAEAKECLRLSAYWAQGRQSGRYREVELAVLMQQVPADSMRRYYTRTLAGLLSREPEYAKEMLHTLEVYLECDGHINETAKKLFIHRNTATYRMEKLSEILEVDFKKTNDLLRLKLAFLFRRMQEQDTVVRLPGTGGRAGA
ncbi:PucR family transcriptional regulator [Paenibacillus spiritus]|uniref:PucR family transcriptional regulator n=1 Tax=Paenibacillus spiritus TaxID=2496557 RepID=A0A5J5GBJ7_9BACL|nr:PucR family transcriptional regulator [Paenibacillus spiritus]KAA9005509.1 PucR family transcriptional regulator [Paenibacillus spiritus]